MTLYQFLYLGFQVFATFFVLGVASILLETEDDDDDPRGGKLIPCHDYNGFF